jgi:hypothetical protein
MRRRALVVGIVALLAPLVAARAQSERVGSSAAASAVFARARQLVINGSGAAGRLLVDSVLAATSPDSADYPEALYWRAALAASPGDAERDYRRIVVEYTFSPRTGDALIQLAQLELARSDRDAAESHLRRFLIEQPDHGQRGRAGYLLARLLIDRNDIPRGCAALARTRTDVPADSVELRNQVDYLVPRCDGVDTSGARSGGAAGDSSAAPTSSSATGRGNARAPAPATTGKYTIQVASYQTREAADALAKRLTVTGTKARVVGKTKPYRVRVGYFETRAAAAETLKQLRTKGYKNPFVTETADER